MDNEAEYLWGRRKTKGSWLFYINRYFGLFATVISAATSQMSPPADVSLALVLLALRIYALYNRSRRILAWMIGTFLVMLGIFWWAVVNQKSIADVEIASCHFALAYFSRVRR
ncbi:hypothetical protein H0H93_009789 [Arthromyces matolae]|nr:hypothetical protein H0H93_009789 [Arthromyces matolae]